MSETARALASGDSFEFKGTTYLLRPLTFYALAKYSTWLEATAWEAAERAKLSLSPDAHKALLRGIASDIACRLYEPGGPYFLKSTSSRAGELKVLELMVEGEVDKEILIDIFLDRAKWEEVQAKMGALNSDPKALRGMMIPDSLT